MKPTTLLIYIFILVTSVSADVDLGQKLKSSHEDKDYTLQPLPVAGINEDTIVLWNGDDMLGYFKNTFEAKPMSHLEYILAFEKTLRDAVKDLSMVFRKDFSAPKGLKISSFRVQYHANDETVYQLIYITTIDGGHQVNVFTCVEPKEFESSFDRVDKILKAATQK